MQRGSFRSTENEQPQDQVRVITNLNLFVLSAHLAHKELPLATTVFQLFKVLRFG
jgi:hypothetical protein